MKITIKDISTDAPVSGMIVIVDGTDVGTTDVNGQILSAPAGLVIESFDNFKLTFTDPLDDREIWIDSSMLPPPPPPPPPGGP